jgi:putative phosphoesterase
MRLLLLSDLHGNIDALLAMEAALASRGEHCDHVFVLGDLVDYGPEPAAVVAWVRRNAHHAIRGNHDHAMATGVDCQSSFAFKELSVATREYFRARLGAASLEFLKSLPSRLSVTIDRREICLVHATPRNPLFEYLGPDAPDDAWREALGPLAESTDYVFLGHTHLPFVRRIGRTTVVNPGSLGQPKDGDPRACYAVVDDWNVDFRRVGYDVERAVARLNALDLERRHVEALAGVLRSGGRLLP